MRTRTLFLTPVAALVCSLSVAVSAAATVPFTNTAVPVVSGQPYVGQTLTMTNGSWSLPPTSYVYSWHRCDSAGARCTNAQVSTRSYILSAVDVGKTIRGSVKATYAPVGQAATTAVGLSAPTALIQTAPAKPVLSAAPVISGSAVVGQPLKTTNGTWTGTGPIIYGYQWQACSSTGNACAAILGGSNSSSYTLSTAEQGKTIRAVVTASNAGGSTTANSGLSAVVTTGAPPPTTTPPPASSTGGSTATCNPSPCVAGSFRQFTTSADDGSGAHSTSRSYQVYRPGNLQGAAPAVFVNGPLGGTYWLHEAVTQRFVLVVLSKGLPLNVATKFWTTPESSPDDRTGCGVNLAAVCSDVPYVLKVLSEVLPGGIRAAAANLDSTKVRDWGASNGGQFAMNLACDSRSARYFDGFGAEAVQWRSDSSAAFTGCPGFSTHPFTFDVTTGVGDAGMTGCTLPISGTSCEPGALRANPCLAACPNPNEFYWGPFTGQSKLAAALGCGGSTTTAAGLTGKWQDKVALCPQGTAVRLSLLMQGSGHAEALLVGTAGTATTPNTPSIAGDGRDTIHDLWVFWTTH